MHIQKVLNSSVVLVQDDSGEESILLGKGIGYGRKAGEPIERQPSDRVFLAVPEISGIILNPWNRTIQLDKTLIRIIKGA